MKKKIIFYSLVASLAVGICAVAVTLAKNVKLIPNQTRAEEISVSTGEFGDDLTTDYQQFIEAPVGDKKDAPVLVYQLAKINGDNNLVLAPAGRIFNYSGDAAYSGRITNMVSITVSYTGGSLFIQEGISGGYENYGPKETISNGVVHNFVSSPNHFMITNSGSETTITSITFNYTCSEAGYSLERLGDTYDGKGSDGNVYTFTREDDVITINGSYSGSLDLDNEGNFTISVSSLSAVYTGKVTPDHNTFNFATHTGGGPDFYSLNRVYTVDDFEDYADRGTGYSNVASLYTASNLRAEYWVDHEHNSGESSAANTWVSGSSFKMPVKANYLNLTSTAHSGSQAMLVGSPYKYGWVRIWNRDIWNTNQHFSLGQGDTFSFWIHSAQSNNTGTTALSEDFKLSLVVYYSPDFTLTDSTRKDTSVGTGLIINQQVITSGTGWNKISVPIDPAKRVYGFNIMIYKSSGADWMWVPVDDIQISTAPTYSEKKDFVENENRFTKTYSGTVPTSYGNWTIKLATGANGYIYAYCGANMEPIDYTVVGSQIMVRTNGAYDAGAYGTFSYGDWTGTLSDNNSTITINKSDITGEIAQAITASSITLHEDQVLFRGNEGTAQLQGVLQRQAHDWTNWNADTESADRITENSFYHIEGTSAIQVKTGSIKSSVIINPTVAQTMSVNLETIAFWYYVPDVSNCTIQVFTYNAYDPKGAGYKNPLSKNFTGGSDTGWHYFNSGLEAGYGKNIRIVCGTSGGAGVTPFIIDYITYIPA